MPEYAHEPSCVARLFRNNVPASRIAVWLRMTPAAVDAALVEADRVEATVDRHRVVGHPLWDRS